MQVEFVVTHCAFNDARGPGPKQWTVILRPIDPAVQVNIEIPVYTAQEIATGTRYMLAPSSQVMMPA